MLRKFVLFLTLTAGMTCGSFLSLEAIEPTAQQMTVFLPTDLKWTPGPSSLPTGVNWVILEGDMSKIGPFTIRIKFPAGYQLPPNWHPQDEHVTVLSGVLHVGFGSKVDQTSGRALPVGSFALIAAKATHYAWTTEETIIQMNGNGPWDIYYLYPKDDPRKP